MDGDGLREVYDQMVEQSGSSEDLRAIERLQRYAARVLPRSKTDGKPILPQALLYRLESMILLSSLIFVQSRCFFSTF